MGHGVLERACDGMSPSLQDFPEKASRLSHFEASLFPESQRAFLWNSLGIFPDEFSVLGAKLASMGARKDLPIATALEGHWMNESMLVTVQ